MQNQWLHSAGYRLIARILAPMRCGSGAQARYRAAHTGEIQAFSTSTPGDRFIEEDLDVRHPQALPRGFPPKLLRLFLLPLIFITSLFRATCTAHPGGARTLPIYAGGLITSQR